MKMRYIRRLILFLVIFAAFCDSTDLEVIGTPNASILNVKSGRIDQIDAIRNTSSDNNNSSKQIRRTKDHNGQTNSNITDTKEIGKKKNNLDKGSELKDVHQDGVLPMKEKIRTEECDPSNQCRDNLNTLIACIRVPGNDSPDLSLLVQNKGKGSMNVDISASDSVWLEKTRIQLQEKEDVKVKVSIKPGGSDNQIILTAGNGNCTLEFRNLASHNSFKTGAGYVFIFFAPLLVIISVMIWLRKPILLLITKNKSNSPKYEQLDMELPVSSNPIIDNNNNNNHNNTNNNNDNDLINGWDDSWNDGWDDEEAPALLPVSPSISSKGVSSRKSKKDGWKD